MKVNVTANGGAAEELSLSAVSEWRCVLPGPHPAG